MRTNYSREERNPIAAARRRDAERRRMMPMAITDPHPPHPTPNRVHGKKLRNKEFVASSRLSHHAGMPNDQALAFSLLHMQKKTRSPVELGKDVR